MGGMRTHVSAATVKMLPTMVATTTFMRGNSDIRAHR
jgi:hypothetical protein